MKCVICEKQVSKKSVKVRDVRGKKRFYCPGCYQGMMEKMFPQMRASETLIPCQYYDHQREPHVHVCYHPDNKFHCCGFKLESTGMCGYYSPKIQIG